MLSRGGGEGSGQLGWVARSQCSPAGRMLLQVFALLICNNTRGGLVFLSLGLQPFSAVPSLRCSHLAASRTERVLNLMISGTGTQWCVCRAGVVGRRCRQHSADGEHLKAEWHPHGPHVCAPVSLCCPRVTRALTSYMVAEKRKTQVEIHIFMMRARMANRRSSVNTCVKQPISYNNPYDTFIMKIVFKTTYLMTLGSRSRPSDLAVWKPGFLT